MHVDEIERRRLESGERHVEGIPRELRVRQRIFFLVSRLRAPIQRRAAGIRHAKHACNLVKALPRRVVPRGAEDSKVRVAPHVDDQRVPARDDEADKGRLQIRVREVICRDVAPDVVHRHQRKAHGVSRRFREIHADQNRTDQPRRIRHSNRIQLPARKPACHERLIRQTVNCLNMLARRNFRYHAAVELVELHLRGNAIGQNFAPIAHDGNRRFIARGLYR